MNFYKLQSDAEVRYYKNLKKLCLAQDLKYSTVYYHIKKNDIYQHGDTTIQKCRFQK